MEPLSNIFQKGDSPYLYGYQPSTPLAYPITSNSQAVGEAQKPRVLLFSLRNIDQAIFRGSLYEFEDVIMSVDAVRLLSPHQEPRSGGKLYRSLETRMRARLGMIQRPNLIPTPGRRRIRSLLRGVSFCAGCWLLGPYKRLAATVAQGGLFHSRTVAARDQAP